MAKRWFIAALVLYAVSLFVPALVVYQRPIFGGGGDEQAVPGLLCLIFGCFTSWYGLLAWIANPLFVIALVCYGVRIYSLVLGLMIVALASAVYALFLMGSQSELRYPHIGYFLWVASLISLGIAAAIQLRAGHSESRSSSSPSR